LKSCPIYGTLELAGTMETQETWIPVHFYTPARKVVRAWPVTVRKELGSILTRLQKREFIGMPDVRPMPDVSPGVCEIRIPDRVGSFRAFYVIQTRFGILLFHAFQKKTRKIHEAEKRTARLRLKAFLAEFEEAP